MGDAPVPLNTNNTITIYIIVLVLLILLSGLFSATETAYSSASRIKLRTLVANGNKKAKKTLFLAENSFDKLLTAILVGNNIVNLTASTICVLLFQNILGETSNYSLISTIVITVAVLIFGEITPKFIAKLFPEKFAIFFYPFAIFFYYTLYIFNFIFGGFKWLIQKIFRLKVNDKITEEEIMTVVEEAEEDGTLKKDETRLIRSVIEFDDLEVGDILVPRVNMVAIDVATPMEEIKTIFENEGYSRLPVFQDSIDTIIGTIHEKDFFNAYLKGKKNIDEILQNAFYTTEHVKISKLLKLLQKKKVHICVVLDEYGGTLGMITLEDILEELVGEIWDEHDEEINYFKSISENTVQVDGNAPLSDFFEYFGKKDDEEQFDALTLSGWIIETLGEIPRVGVKFDYKNLNIEILKSTVKRVLSVKITVNEQETETE